jgi:hypothetical protein
MEHIPPGYVSLVEKLDEVGRTNFGEQWCGAKAWELRERANRLQPRLPLLLRTPLPKLLPNDWWRDRRLGVAVNAERIRIWEEAEKQAVKAEGQWSQVTAELRSRLYGTPPKFTDAHPAYEQLPDGRLSLIPHHRWFGDIAPYMFITGKTEGGRSILIPQPVSRYATQGGSSIKAETHCQKWLVTKMKAGKPTKTREEYRAEAADKFKVGSRAFSRAWANAIAEAKNLEWRKPGPRSKRGIDSPDQS